jgi:hypothetical protein
MNVEEEGFHTEITVADGGALRFNSHDKSLYAILEAQCIEVEQEPDVITAHAEICQNLRFMNRQELLHGLDLDDQLPRNDDIGAETGIQGNPFIDDRHVDLPFKLDTCLLEFEAETTLIYRFQQSRPNLSMQLDRQPNDLLSQFSANQHIPAQWPSVCLVLLRVKP